MQATPLTCASRRGLSFLMSNIYRAIERGVGSCPRGKFDAYSFFAHSDAQKCAKFLGNPPSSSSPPLMMIIFITTQSSLVPLIEGLCAQIYFRLEISVSLRSHLFPFLFWKQKYVKHEKELVQDLILPCSIHIHMCTLYTDMNTHMPRFCPSELFGPSRSLIPTPWLTSEYPAVCVCMHIHTHTHTYTPTCNKNRKHIDNTPTSPSVNHNPPRQATIALID